MKRRILTAIVIIISLFSITVAATDYEYTISTGSNFTVGEYGKNLDSLSKKTNMSTEQLNRYFEDNSLIYFAVSDNLKTQIKISAVDNALSEVTDISQLSEKAIDQFAKTISQNDTSIITNNGRKYVCVKSAHKDSGGIYTVTQYSTIFDKKIISFIGYNDGNNTAQEIATAFESFSLGEKDNLPNNNNISLSIVLTIIGIIVFTAIATVMIIGIIKNIRNKDDD